MAIDPGTQPPGKRTSAVTGNFPPNRMESVQINNPKDKGNMKDFIDEATEIRIATRVTGMIMQELTEREKVFVEEGKAPLTGHESRQFFEPISMLLKQMTEMQFSLLGKVDKLEMILTKVSSQLQKERTSLVDFQLGKGSTETQQHIDSRSKNSIHPGFKRFNMPINTEDILNTTRQPVENKYNLLDLRNDLQEFKLSNEFHNFEICMTASGQTDIQVRAGKINLLTLVQILDTYISQNALHTLPKINGWGVDKTLFEIKKEGKTHEVNNFQDFANIMMLDAQQGIEIEPQTQSPMTMLELFTVYKRKDFDSVGTFFSAVTISFNMKQQHFIISKVDHTTRASNVFSCINEAVGMRVCNDHFEFPVLLETKDSATSSFRPLYSPRQLAEWLLVE